MECSLAFCRKLAVFDTWSSLAVHIAMDNTVVMEEISKCVAQGVAEREPQLGSSVSAALALSAVEACRGRQETPFSYRVH